MVEFVKVGSGAHSFAVTVEKWRELREKILEIVAGRQASDAEFRGVTVAELGKALQVKTHRQVLSAALRELVAEGRLQNQSQLFFLPGGRQKIADKASGLAELIVTTLREGGVPPPTIHEISARTSLAPKIVFDSLNRASSRGIVRRVGENRFFLSETVCALAKRTEQISHSAEDGWFAVSDFRESTGIGRRPSVELLEYFDKVGFTVREGDRRRVLKPATGVFGGLSV
jgi:selenocysteine-specific elongation factor